MSTTTPSTRAHAPDDATGDPRNRPRGTAGPLTAVDVLLRTVALRGDALAVSAPEGSVGYRELLARAAAGAVRIAALVPPGTPPSAPVAVMATNGLDAVVAVVAVVLAGRPLAVLDTQLPVGRLGDVQAVAGAALCLADAAHRGAASAVPGLPLVAPLEDVVAPAEPGADPVAAWRAARPVLAGASTATTVFTSGSTGAPKGVLVGHAMLVDAVGSAEVLLGSSPETRFGMLVPPAFGIGQHALLATLLTGGSLHVWDPRERGLRDLPAWLVEQRVTTAVATPSLLRALTAAVPTPAAGSAALPDLALVACSGEALQGADVRLARERLGPQLTVVNAYGCSETWLLAHHRVDPGDEVPEGALPVGRPAPGVRLDVVDDDGRVLPAGATGLLRATAAHFASGYQGLDDPAFSSAPDGQDVFLVRDRVRLGEDGLLRALGRADDAVKVRGYYVEPAEVEAALGADDGVAEAAVVGVREGPGAPVLLVAYVVPSAHARTPSPAHLRHRLRERLPEWMVPTEVVMLAALPRTERGKVDRAALPRPQRPAHEPPAGRWEVAAAALWSQVLGREDVGRSDSFTALGGDSLAVEELVVRAREVHGAVLTTSRVAEAATLADFAAVLAAHVDGGRRAVGHGTVVVLRAPRDDGAGGTDGGDPSGPGRTPVHCFAGAGAGALSFLGLAGALGPDQPVVAHQPHGTEQRALPDLSVSMAARRHLTRLREVQPHGPYVLVGHSMGGLVALQVARLLQGAGEEVASVVLIDTYAPRGPRALLGALAREALGRRAAPGAASREGRAGAAAATPAAGLWRDRAAAVAAAAGVRTRGDQAQQLRELGVRTSQLHRRRPWHGRAVVFRSHLNPDAPTTWDGLLTGPTAVSTLAGDHNSLLRSPHVEAVAAAVAAEVARTDAPEPTPRG